MHRVGATLVFAFLIAACGDPGAEGGSGASTTTRAPAATSPSTTIDTTIDTTVVTTVVDMTASDPEPGATRGLVGRSIEDALLPDEAFEPPWEPQWRQIDSFGYDQGPNQTDCPGYWTLERFRSSGGGHVMWWADGGNANQYVTRVDAPFDLDELRELGGDCPRVTWNEGGAFSIEEVPLEHGVGFRFVDGGSNEVTWFAVTAHDDLVAVLDIPLWEVDGAWIEFTDRDLDALVTRMHDRLVAAPIVELPPPVTTPGRDPATTITTTTTTTITTTPTTTTATTTTTMPLDELAAMLLDGDDVAALLDVGAVRPYRPGGTEDELVATCPAAVSIEQIDAVLRWTRSSEGAGSLEVDQQIGRAASPVEAAEMVRTFALVGECDLSAVFDGDVSAAGGVADVAGASIAARLIVELPDDLARGELLAIAVDDVVTIVASEFAVDDEPFDLVAVAELAVQRIISRR